MKLLAFYCGVVAGAKGYDAVIWFISGLLFVPRLCWPQ